MLDLTHPLVAFANLATGERLRSTPTMIAVASPIPSQERVS